ncbi:ribonuclease P protein component [Winogradskyella undariae]|uniref:ribonuclease P protein component n=1 Tax=Winogradskyella undariae TaxID=1285465 RepID=UPI00156B4774|nr:ribonuclease P protein component [Winogradskyella undariae]NRR91432.1 ribonuclease P protein component [Winogradskyella undariae]QNK76854.1 ribonuclease P protein component [Winogradskyella sp. PAMC22761]
MPFKYSQKDKLKSKKLIEALFTNGKVITAYPLRLVYIKTEFEDGSQLKTGVSVSKRLHKTAVSRNQIKRLLREAYRLNKPLYFNNSSNSYAFMILYLSKDGTTFDKVNKNINTLFKKFLVQNEPLVEKSESNTSET